MLKIRLASTMILPLVVFVIFDCIGQQRYTISGAVENINDAQFVHIEDSYKDPVYRDSVRVTGGKFSFSGSIAGKDPRRYYLYLSRLDSRKPLGREKLLLTDFFIEKGNIAILINKLGYKEGTYIKGTPTNIDYMEISQKKHEFERYMQAYRDTAKVKWIGELYNDGLRKIYKDFIAEHPDSYMSVELISSDLWKIEKPVELWQQLATLSSEMQHTSGAVRLREQLLNTNLVTVGKVAPEFTEKDQYGKSIMLSDYKGKYVLIDFWASWCRPCREENPNLLSAYNSLKGKNFDILSISMDASKTAWLKAIGEDKLPWTQVSSLNPNNSESALKYGVKAIPRNFLIDPNGKIIAMDLRGKDLREKVKLLLQ